jgi:hypothetical protein
MELIASHSGQSLQLIVMDEVKPLRGGVFLGDLGPAIIERYRFMKGDPLVPGQPAKFQTGVLRGDVTRPIESLEIYQDGVLATSTTTDDADIILNDLFSWMTQTFALRSPVTQIPRNYQSGIVVSLDGSLNRFISNFQKMGELLTSTFRAQAPLSVTRLSVGPNPPTQYPFQTTWNIEPRLGQPYVPNRYMSAAPLATTTHFELLAALEAAIG